MLVGPHLRFAASNEQPRINVLPRRDFPAQHSFPRGFDHGISSAICVDNGQLSFLSVFLRINVPHMSSQTQRPAGTTAHRILSTWRCRPLACNGAPASLAAPFRRERSERRNLPPCPPRRTIPLANAVNGGTSGLPAINTGNLSSPTIPVGDACL